MAAFIVRVTLSVLATLLLAATLRAESSATPAQLPGKVAVEQKMGAQLPFDTMFRDESGKVVRLGDYFKDGKPVLLTFMYYRCPMLCSMVMEGTTSVLTELKFDIGNEYKVLTISFDPRDMPESAQQRKDIYVKRYGRSGAANGWHFLTGNDTQIHSVTDAVGYYYAYDGQRDQFAHPTTMVVITPDGKVSRYLHGFEYKPRDVRLALVEAASRHIGTVSDAVLLLCYHYDPATGRYSRSAMNFVRAGGIATVLSLAGFIFVMTRREKQAAAAPDAKERS